MVAAGPDERWPLGDVGVFRAHDALEHLRDPIHTMKELHRCLAWEGWLLSQTPSIDGRGAFQDPTHVSFSNSNSFWYYTRADQIRLIDCPVRFQENRLKNFFPSGWHRDHPIVYVKADLLRLQDGCRVAWRFDTSATKICTNSIAQNLAFIDPKRSPSGEYSGIGREKTRSTEAKVMASFATAILRDKSRQPSAACPSSLHVR